MPTKQNYNPGTAKHSQLKAGDRLSYTSYLTVQQVRGEHLTVTDARGISFDIVQEAAVRSDESKSMVNMLMHSASTVVDTKIITRTEIINVLAGARDSIFTITYRRQPDPVEVFDQIKQGNKLMSHAEQKKRLKEGMKGTTRVLIGHLLGDDERNMGRTLVLDLECGEPRLVDHRTIDKLILRGVEYVVKGK